MIAHEVIQGTPEWLRLRAGIPTASQFHRIITPKTRRPSAQMEAYRNELIAERFLGRPLLTSVSDAMREGSIREDEAASFYEMMHGGDIQLIGFCTTDDGQIGCSPDRLVGSNGLLELKNPGIAQHINYMLGTKELDGAYFCQLQGQMLVTGRAWVDICSYYPGLPHVVIRAERDESFIEPMEKMIRDLVADVDWQMRKLLQLGYQPIEPKPLPESADPFGVTEEDVDRIIASRAKIQEAQ